MDEQIKAPTCIQCQHIATNASQDWETYRCMAPENFASFNLVTGAKNYSVAYCKLARLKDAKGSINGIIQTLPTCGPEGKWFKLKDVSHTAADKLYSEITGAKTKPLAGMRTAEDLGL